MTAYLHKNTDAKTTQNIQECVLQQQLHWSSILQKVVQTVVK